MGDNMSLESEFGVDYAQTQLSRERNPLRRFIKSFYLDNILRDIEGPTLDFGCGTGQLLARLPHGSVGIEVNPHLVDELKRRHLNVIKYEPDTDGFSLPDIEVGCFTTLVLSHVLEHFDNADACLKKLLASCARVGIRRVIIVVPGARGYRSDATHRTFVTRDYLASQNLFDYAGFHTKSTHYFPVNVEGIGEYFKFHELHTLYVRDI
jgi:SAM-dependent methyltransferase